MKRLALALSLWLGFATAALAQSTFTMPPPAGVVLMGLQVVASCGGATLTANQLAYFTMDTTGKPCGGSGGGGGLSVVDQTAFVQGTSAFTPTGGVFNDTATLSSGQEGTVRLTTDRQMKVLDSAVLAAVQSPVPAGTNYIGQIGPWVAPLSFVSGTTSAMTGTTSTQLLALVASKKLYVLSISCVNSHATQGTFVSVQDGSGGTILATLAAAPAFGGDEKTSVGPLFSTSAGNGLYVADVTTGANVICNASGFAQ